MGGVNPSDLISAEYLVQIRNLHARKQRWGVGGYKYAERVMALAREVGASTILDYGCGLGTLKENVTGFDVREYDPGIIGKDAMPSQADVVVCTDVLEHIECDHVDAVLDHICSLTLKACFAVISMRAASARLPDGRNAHLIVRGAKWWIAYLETKDWSVEVIERADEDKLIVCLRK